MAFGTLLAGGVGLVQKTGFKPGRAVKKIFGGGKEPNAGSSSLVDALDNYEKISQSKARSLEGRFTQMIHSGATEDELERFLASQTGYNQGDLKASWKWRIVSDWINQTRSMVTPRNTAPQKPTPGANFGTGLNAKNPMVYVWAVVLTIVGIYAFNQ